MVDFAKRLGRKAAIKPVDPIEIYDTLDRAHDKGPLRPSQEAVLREWKARQANTRDVVVKLHTGQGKTLVGLLMLQSRLNAGKGPVVYLCPDHFLIELYPGDLPQKLFNGLTKVGLNRASIGVGTVLMDDAHACADRIRAECRIRIPISEPAYSSLKALFATDLEEQGVGSYADIDNAKREALLPVPYWAWIERESEVASILSSQTDRKSVKFAWPLLRDMLRHCPCIVSGAAVEIEPYVPPLNAFGSYSSAVHRVFMSATVTDDSFLVKGLRLSPETITTPLPTTARLGRARRWSLSLRSSMRTWTTTESSTSLASPTLV
jgi:replicative superfamily II helicase